MKFRVEIEGYESFLVEEGETLLDACDTHAIPMASECGGFAGCNSCRIRVLEGSDRISPCAPEEIPFLDHEDHRLGCQIEIFGHLRGRLEPGM